MKLKETESLVYSNTKDFNSSAVSLITVDTNNNTVQIVFNSNTNKSYEYSITNTEFVESLSNTIKNKESIGVFVSKSIKLGNITQINTNNQWLLTNSTVLLVTMAKNNRKYQEINPNHQYEDDYEDFGYEVKNAKRYAARSKRQAKFKDYDDTYSEWS